jgi:hypothetical protein
MAISTGQLTVGTIPVQIDSTSTSNFKMHIHNADPQANLYLGNGNVSTTNGLILAKSDSTILDCYPGETIWVVSETEGHLVSWLKQV